MKKKPSEMLTRLFHYSHADASNGVLLKNRQAGSCCFRMDGI